MTKRIIAIGGGEIKNRTTLKIDEYIASLAKINPKNGRAYGLFLGTASHDSMPYFNSFRKTYTSVFDIKADCALIVYGEMDMEKIKSKFEKADFIYIGGGDTVYMINKWKESGMLDLIMDAYERGVIICGLSAGAICWFDDMYTDHDIMANEEGEYAFMKGLGVLKGLMTPHYDSRKEFDENFLKSEFTSAIAVDNDCAIEFVDGKLTGSISAGGKAYIIDKTVNGLNKTEITPINR